MENRDPLWVRTHFRSHFESTHRRFIAVNLGIALVCENAEIVFLGQRNQLAPVVPRRHSTLWVRRGTDVSNRRAIQHIRRHRRIVRQEPIIGGRRNENSLRTNRNRSDHIDLIERVRRQDDRPFAVLRFRAKRHGSIIKPLTRPVQRHDPIRPNDDAIATVNPCRNCGQQIRLAIIGRVFRKTSDVVGQDIPNPRRERVLWLSNGQRQRLSARFMDVE